LLDKPTGYEIEQQRRLLAEAGALNLSECQGDATRIRRARGGRHALSPAQQSGEPQLIEYDRNRECHHQRERTPDDCLLDALRQVYVTKQPTPPAALIIRARREQLA
jgi:hypothetical protein